MKEIRVLLLNGSPRANGNTALALREMEKVFAQNGVQTETVLLGNQAIRGCTACGACAKLGRCVFDDVVNELAPKLEGGGRAGRRQPGLLRLGQRDAHRLPGPPVLLHAL